MKIWEERRTSRYGKKETDRLFQYFQMYLAQEGQRSVRRLYEDLKSTNNPSNSPRIPKYETLKNYCTVFNWVERVKAYDQYQQEQLLKQKEKNNLELSNKISEFRLKEFDVSTTRVKYPTKALHDAYKQYCDGVISLREYTDIIVSLNKAYDNGMETIDRLDPASGKNGVVVNNAVGDGNIITNHTFHELLNEDLLQDLTDDEYTGNNGQDEDNP